MKRLKRLLAMVVSFALVATTYCTPLFAVDAPDTYSCQLYGEVTDAGEVVSKMVIDYGAAKKVTGVGLDTFTVHAKASTEDIRQGTQDTSYGDYDLDRKIVKVEVEGQYVNIYFNQSEGATLAYLSSGRNYPAELTYTVTQNKPVTLTAADGTVINDSYTGNYTCDNTVINAETAKFESVKVKDGINYQYYDAGSADSLIVWFHGNGEGDYLSSGNNVAQMLANRGTVAWATDETQNIFGGAHVMAFQAPDTWYYAQNDGLLEKAYNEINEVIKAKNIDPDKVFVSGCSAGGYMTTRMLIAYPDLFAAAMINCPALDVADARGGETPTDAELASIKNSDTAIWLVQGKTDSSVKPEDCSIRLFNALTDPSTGASSNKLEFAEDYDQDGVATLVQYSDHWSWIYTLNNNPKDAKGVSIMNWAAEYGKTAEQPTPAPVPETPADTPKTSVKTGDSVSLGLYAITTLAGLCGIALLKKRYN